MLDELMYLSPRLFFPNSLYPISCIYNILQQEYIKPPFFPSSFSSTSESPVALSLLTPLRTHHLPDLFSSLLSPCLPLLLPHAGPSIVGQQISIVCEKVHQPIFHKATGCGLIKQSACRRSQLLLLLLGRDRGQEKERERERERERVCVCA